MLNGITMFGKFISSLESSQLDAAAPNGLPCPSCGVMRMDLAGNPKRLVTCRDCGHVATAINWFKGLKFGRVGGRVDQPPANTHITKHSAGNSTTWEIPPSGRSGGLLLFGWIWTGFSVLSLGGISHGQALDGNSLSSAKLLPIGMLVLFLSIGIGMLYAAYRSKNAKHQVTVGGGTMTLRREWRGRVKELSLPTRESIFVDQVAFNSSNNKPVYCIEVRGGSNKFRFGGTLTPEEKGWLVAEFKDAIDAAAATPDGRREREGMDIFSLAVPKSGSLLFLGLLFLLMSAGVALLGWKIVPGKGGWAVGSQTILLVVSGIFFLVGASITWVALRRAGFETRLEGSRGQLAIRKTKKGMTISEKVFERSSYCDIRTEDCGHQNGKRMKRIELLIGGNSEDIGTWIDGDKADDFVTEFRKIMGSHRLAEKSAPP
jgi:uncharacterized membrane protein